jgi:hypothetical protein
VEEDEEFDDDLDEEDETDKENALHGLKLFDY